MGRGDNGNRQLEAYRWSILVAGNDVMEAIQNGDVHVLEALESFADEMQDGTLNENQNNSVFKVRDAIAKRRSELERGNNINRLIESRDFGGLSSVYLHDASILQEVRDRTVAIQAMENYARIIRAIDISQSYAEVNRWVSFLSDPSTARTVAPHLIGVTSKGPEGGYREAYRKMLLGIAVDRQLEKPPEAVIEKKEKVDWRELDRSFDMAIIEYTNDPTVRTEPEKRKVIADQLRRDWVKCRTARTPADLDTVRIYANIFLHDKTGELIPVLQAVTNSNDHKSRSKLRELFVTMVETTLKEHA